MRVVGGRVADAAGERVRGAGAARCPVAAYYNLLRQARRRLSDNTTRGHTARLRLLVAGRCASVLQCASSSQNFFISILKRG